MTDAGRLNGIKLTYYADCGNSPNDNSLPPMQAWADNGTLFVISFISLSFKCLTILYDFSQITYYHPGQIFMIFFFCNMNLRTL